MLMRAENFSWSNSIYLVVEGQEFDLHNCYDFHSFAYSIATRSVSLVWFRGTGEWVDNDLPTRLCIDIFEVNYLKIHPRDPEMPFTEDDCLSSFGYDCDEDWADGQFWVDGPAEPNWRWSFEFQSGAEIFIGGERAVVTLQSKKPDD